MAREVHGVAGTVWHVSTAGLDTNDGLSWLTPFLTPYKATTVAAAGDLILLGLGTFNNGSNHATIPAGVKVRGQGIRLTTIQAAGVTDSFVLQIGGNNVAME